MRGTELTYTLIDKIKTNVDCEVYPVEVKLGSKLPFIHVIRTSSITSYNKDYGYMDTCNVTISIITRKYKENIELTNEVLECVDVRNIGKIKNIEITNIFEDYIPENDCYMNQITLSCNVMR